VQKKDEKESKPLYLIETQSDELPKRQILKSPRVGLNMTKSRVAPELQQRFVFKCYRYFTQPKAVVKGKHYMTLALLFGGKQKKEITDMIGATSNAVDKAIALLEEGKKKNPNIFVGQKMSDDDVCRCFGSIMYNKPN